MGCDLQNLPRILGHTELCVDSEGILDKVQCVNAAFGRRPALDVPDKVDYIDVVVDSGDIVDGVVGGYGDG